MYKPLQLLHIQIPGITQATFRSSAIQFKKIVKDNVLKNFNTENKKLFGALLETQAQRKKRLKQEGVLVDANDNKSKENTPSHPLLEEEHVIQDQCLDNRNPTVDNKENSTHFDNVLSHNPVEDQPQTGAFITDYTSLSLQEILKSAFPLQNPSKSLEPASDQISFLNQTKPGNRNPDRFPSVTSILSATMSAQSRRALDIWKQNKIAELGLEGFLAMNKATMAKGRDFHTAIEQALLRTGNGSEFAPDIQNCLKSVAKVIAKITNVRAIESQVVHQVLKYHGYVDCICDFGGRTNVAIDWKKSDKKKPTIDQTYDAPLQVAAYMGAINYDHAFNFPVRK
uniref:Mitochondrial genome maintenance exonuclease 1 n=1 Tax=Cacopsylla melanoneura TaxID=428564 RepID=A0A8D8YYA2_9HEMI